MSDLIQFPEAKPVEFIIGPFEEYRVVIDGRRIPGMTARDHGDRVSFTIDHRFGASVPKDDAYSVAWLIANAMAIASGYPSMNSESKDRPFAPRCAELTSVPTK